MIADVSVHTRHVRFEVELEGGLETTEMTPAFVAGGVYLHVPLEQTPLHEALSAHGAGVVCADVTEVQGGETQVGGIKERRRGGKCARS